MSFQHLDRWTLALLCALSCALVVGLATSSCSSEDGAVTTPTGTTGVGGSGGGTTTTGTGGALFGGHGPTDFVSLEISPADPVVVVENGVVPDALALQVLGHTEDGDVVPTEGQWSFDRYDLGTVGEMTGQFTATGLLGGVGTVTVELGELSATTSLTVQLHVTSEPTPVDATVKTAFANATAEDPSLALLYPYNETVFARGLIGPVVQWNGGGANDIYYVHARSSGFDFEFWGTVPPPSRFAWPTTPLDAWKVLTDSTDGPVTFTVQRWDGTQAYLAKTQVWNVAPANLGGTVYYWAISWGNVVRLQMGASAPEDFLQKGSHSCVACHSVSASGNRIVAAFDGGRSPWAVFDAATGALEHDSNQASGFEAISPQGDYVLWRHWNEAMTSDGHLVLSAWNDATPLAYLDPGTGAGTGPSHPAWSPDGNKIAFSVRATTGGLYFGDSDLWVADVSTAPAAFSNVQRIVDNTAEQPTLTYPTFAPDSTWIAYMAGNHAYCDSGAMGYPIYGDILLTNASGTTPINLATLNGDAYLPSDSQHFNYQPSFLPVAVGGYYWLVFASDRTYGNTLTQPDVMQRVKQLWVAAINANPQNGQDPSHPAFWLPGQELTTENMRGQWALSPCKLLGEVCTAGYDCCDGYCRDDGSGVYVCQDQPGPCSPDGDACETAADCCEPLAECIGGFCSTPPPQ